MEAILQAKGLEKSFIGPKKEGSPLLSGLDLVLYKGESLSIVGQSGAGKSTLLNLLAGLDKPDRGEVVWGGESIGFLSSNSLNQKRSTFLGIVFQAYYLIQELDVLENILLGWRIARPQERIDALLLARVRTLLAYLGLEGKETALPATLSGGERQRVGLARALVHRPAVVLADEPTGNLDEQTADTVMQLLLGLCKAEGVSLILVTHNTHFAKKTDRATILHEGTLRPLRPLTTDTAYDL